MLKQFKLAVIAFFTLICAAAFAQEESASDSSIIRAPADSAFTENNDDSTSEHSTRFEIDLSIEQVQSPEIIGEFYNDLKYDLSFDQDTIMEKTEEYVADMRAHRTVKAVIYGIWKPIAPNDVPFLLQFKQNIFTGFKPVQPLIQFGF